MAQILSQVGLRRGPLNRRIDRLEGWFRLALVLIFLIVTLPAAWNVGDGIARAGVQQEATQRAGRHQVVARLLENTANAQSIAGATISRIPAVAEWTEPDGSKHRGIVQVPPGSRAGSTQLIWTHTAGAPVTSPQNRDDTVASVAGAILLVIVLIGALMTGLGALAHRRFDRTRYEQWDTEWRRMGQDWSSHG